MDRRGITGRSARQGDIGEFIAAHVLYIKLTSTTVQAGYDGWFRSGPLEGRTVNVKTYGSAAAGIDISSHACDYYLVLERPTEADRTRAAPPLVDFGDLSVRNAAAAR